ncbi:MAG: glycosyl transferase [Bacteroidetes bacterium HGW-Bacteroidetes-8]|jgi:cellulose synthase/poly-beta-1,6-N-acetylglucosamine synthase-like glycosyltransferase|nr:MAG: glycosyl transferase [Bacteroidetes bacterium HGW-Bacteroidetes-8]
MRTTEILFFAALFIVFYTYIGYGILLYLLVRIKRVLKPSPRRDLSPFEPEITILVAAYNEKDFVKRKVENTRALEYPKDKLRQIWVTDGSNDSTPELLKEYPEVTVLHLDERRGKIAAMNRAMKLIDTPYVIFSDANTMLSEGSVRVIADLFRNPKTGCVSGEKRIRNSASDGAAGAGEGIYWRYESTLKKWDAELYSAVGAAGELFAIRTELFREVEPDTLLDDFIISLRVAMSGYKIDYNPNAYAIEAPSESVKEELKRKIRIAAGGIQSIVRLLPLLNIFKYKTLSFQYISHRVLRWTLAPVLLPFIFFLNAALAWGSQSYLALFIAQILFYSLAALGWILQSREIKVKALFIPYYFLIMNYAVYRGFFRYLAGKQSVNWERAKRG